MIQPRQITRNILRIYRATSEDHVTAGMEWYDLAFTECERLAARNGYTVTQAACALAHLSPRVGWRQNVALLALLLSGGPKPRAALSRSWHKAADSLAATDPLGTFSNEAHKTRSFARAIMGDGNAVTVDVWTARAAGVEEGSIRRSSGYIAVADAYRRAARHADLPARELQAITWCHVRGRTS